VTEPPTNKPGAGGFRCGYVAVVGRPNAGKSTLTNALVGLKVSIVAPRPQTTRHRILGILSAPDFQGLLLDTPGLLDPKYPLQQHMAREIDSALADADVTIVVFDAARDPGPDDSTARFKGKRSIAVLNKIDLVPDKTCLLTQAAELSARGFGQVFMVSALRSSGVKDLKAAIGRLLPEGPALYPPDQVADRPEKFFAAEFVRAAVFNLYSAEIPYATATVCEEFSERPGRKDYIKITIFVERDSQKAIIIGQGGRALKRLGSSARRDIEGFLGRPVFLELAVKVAEAWRRDELFIKQRVYGR
jgi:GTP-binding protein Era